VGGWSIQAKRHSQSAQGILPHPLSAISNVPPDHHANLAAQRIRQKRTIAALAMLLIAGGLIILFALTRMPLPMRVLVGLIDVFAGLTLLVLVRQKFT
jgi:hypothetical protein